MKLTFLTLAVATALVTLWTDGTRAADVPLDEPKSSLEQGSGEVQGLTMAAPSEIGSATSGFRAPRFKGFKRGHWRRRGFGYGGGFGYPGFYPPSYGLGIGYAGLYGGPLSWGYWGY